MSLILDALRRADRARERDVAARIAQALPPRTRRASPWPWAVAALALALAVLLVVDRARTPAPMPTQTASRTEPQAAPASAPVSTSTLADIRLPETRSDAAMPEPAPARAALPAALRASLPQVELEAHVWSDDPAKRFVMVDGRVLRAGDDAADGLVLTAIVRDGAEFVYRGTRFRVPAR